MNPLFVLAANLQKKVDISIVFYQDMLLSFFEPYILKTTPNHHIQYEESVLF